MYSNITPPTLPEWDSTAYPYYVLVFMYKKGSKDWYGVRLIYSAAAFSWNGSAVTNAGTAGNMVYSSEFGAWAEDTFAVDTPEIKPGLDGTVYQRIYTSHDILDSSGNVWLAAGAVTEATTTISEAWLRSFQTGLALGLAGKPLPIKKEPVAYLYNGVRLPKLPEWDKEKYPYMIVGGEGYETPSDSRPIELHAFPEIKYSYFMGVGIRAEKDNYFSAYVYNGEWYTTSTDLGKLILFSQIAWTNVDLYNEDGTIFLAASEPVPVYE